MIDIYRKIILNSSKLLIGTIISRVIVFFSSPILSRIYSPLDFGEMATFTAFISILTPLSNLKYSLAIPLAENHHKVEILTTISLIANVVVVLFLTFLFGLLNYFNSMQSLIPVTSDIYIFILLGFFSVSLFELFENIAIRLDEYKLISKLNVINTISAVGAKILLGITFENSCGLIIGQIIQYTGGVIGRIKNFSSSLFKGSNFNIREIKLAINEYSQFPRFNIVSKIILAVAVQFPVFFITAYYSLKDAGYFGFTVSVLFLPVTLIQNTINSPYYSEISKLGKQRIDDIRKITYNFMRTLFLIAFPVSLAFSFFATDIFSVFFGAQWSTAGRFASIMIFYLSAGLVTSPFTNLFNVLNKQKLLMVNNIIRLVSIALACGISILYSFNVFDFIIVYTSAMILQFGVTILMFIKILKQEYT